METKQIDLSYRLFVLAVIIVAALAISYLVGAALNYMSIPGNQPREITVSGEGKVYITPDIATVDISVENEGMDVPAIIKKNTEKMNDIIADIKGLGIDEKDIKTINYNLVPQYNWTEQEGRIFIGYKITNTILVKIRAFEKIGDVLSKATERGANSIGDISFTIEDPEKVTQEARDKAIAQAKTKAETIAKSSGLKLVKLLDVQEGYYPYYYNAMYEKSAEGLGGAGEIAPAPQIQPGQQEVSTTVTLTYRVR